MNHRAVLLLCLTLAACTERPLGEALGTLHGHVRVAADLPAVGATISLPAIARSTTADADGYYALADLPAGNHTLVVSAPSTREDVSAVAVSTNGSDDDKDVLLTGLGVIHARVVSEDGAPLAGVTVGLSDGDGAITTTDTHGDATLTTILGTHQVFFAVSGYRPASTTGEVSWRNTTDLGAIALAAAAGTTGFSGSVYVFGADDQAGTIVHLAGTTLSTTTDASGSFHFEGVQTNSYTIELQHGTTRDRVENVYIANGEASLVAEGFAPLGMIELTLGAQRLGSPSAHAQKIADGRYLVTGPDVRLVDAATATELAIDGAGPTTISLSPACSALAYAVAPADGGAPELVLVPLSAGHESEAVRIPFGTPIGWVDEATLVLWRVPNGALPRELAIVSVTLSGVETELLRINAVDSSLIRTPAKSGAFFAYEDAHRVRARRLSDGTLLGETDGTVSASCTDNYCLAIASTNGQATALYRDGLVVPTGVIYEQYAFPTTGRLLINNGGAFDLVDKKPVTLPIHDSGWTTSGDGTWLAHAASREADNELVLYNGDLSVRRMVSGSDWLTARASASGARAIVWQSTAPSTFTWLDAADPDAKDDIPCNACQLAALTDDVAFFRPHALATVLRFRRGNPTPTTYPSNEWPWEQPGGRATFHHDDGVYSIVDSGGTQHDLGRDLTSAGWPDPQHFAFARGHANRGLYRIEVK